jgi:hypothetical protein
MRTLLFPGRHILHTLFQEQYLLGRLPGRFDRVVFAITSANHSHSRYNPIALHDRAVGVDRFARRLKERVRFEHRVVPIPHFNPTERYATFLLKELREASDGELELTPRDAVVLSSTPGLNRLFRALGFDVLPGELESLEPERYAAATPVEVLKRFAAAGTDWEKDDALCALLAPSTLELWRDFPDLPRRILRLFRDPLLTDHGGLTEMRNYSVYAAGMNERAALALKYEDIRHAVRPGKVVDEGCADGALLVPLARDFPDSDLVGIEITGEFVARCLERQRAMEFGGTYVHFHQRNITEPVFEPGSIDTTICNSTTHELWSYGRQEETLRAYLREKFRQTRRRGRIVIRDVVGPRDKEREVYLWCNDADGSDDDAGDVAATSTAARFRRFARDFLADLRVAGRRGAETALRYREETVGGRRYFVLRLRDAVEFMLKKDYAANWRSEMNEEFAFWDFGQWKRELGDAGFVVLEDASDRGKHSRAYRNEWIVKNRFEGKVELYTRGEGGTLGRMDYPVTNMVLVGERRE